MTTDQIQQKHTEQIIRAEFEATVHQRVRRYLEINHHNIVANPKDTKFASVSTECIDLFRDGYFYGCISLSQTVTEALSKFLCERNGFRPKKDFETNISKLRKKGFIDETTEENFKEIWKERNDYHHLNNSVEIQLVKLEQIAKLKIQTLAKIEKSIFDYSVNNGKIKPSNPQYWDFENGYTKVFLRLK